MIELLHDFDRYREELLMRLREPAPGRIQLLTGPRQVGKTTLLLTRHCDLVLLRP